MSLPGSSVGRHVLADLYGVSSGLLQDDGGLEALLRRAAQAAGARVLGSHFHRFGPAEGITGVVLLAESHLSIHTWPESGMAATDIFMCGTADPERALQVLVAALAPTERRVQTVARGLSEVVNPTPYGDTGAASPPRKA